MLNFYWEKRELNIIVIILESSICFYALKTENQLDKIMSKKFHFVG